MGNGKVRYIGTSNVAAWQLMKALDIPHYQYLERFVSLQAYCTIAGRDPECDLVPLLHVSSGYSYTGGGDNPACALQAGLVIRIGLYR